MGDLHICNFFLSKPGIFCFSSVLKSSKQLTVQINKEISPWLYSKGMKLAKNVLKVASKIALKYDIDGGNGLRALC